MIPFSLRTEVVISGVLNLWKLDMFVIRLTESCCVCVITVAYNTIESYLGPSFKLFLYTVFHHNSCIQFERTTMQGLGTQTNSVDMERLYVGRQTQQTAPQPASINDESELFRHMP